MTYLSESTTELIEYRLGETDHFTIECRGLRRNGKPYDERWYPVSHQEFCRLQECSDIVQILREEFERKP